MTHANIQNVLNHVKSSDFITSELLKVCNEYVTTGKNALIFKAYLSGKKNSTVELLINLGYDFTKAASVNACKGTQLKNRLEKFKIAVEKEYLFNIAKLFTAFAKEPTVKKLQAIKDFNANNSQIVKSIVNKSITDTLFSETLNFHEVMLELPAFLNKNYVESISNQPKPQQIEIESDKIDTDNFNVIKDYIVNDADVETLKLMQELIKTQLAAVAKSTTAA